jgi:hypothetical protein
MASETSTQKKGKNKVHENSKNAFTTLDHSKKVIVEEFITEYPGLTRFEIWIGLESQGIPILYPSVCGLITPLIKAGKVKEDGKTKNETGRSAARLYRVDPCCDALPHTIKEHAELVELL